MPVFSEQRRLTSVLAMARMVIISDRKELNDVKGADRQPG